MREYRRLVEAVLDNGVIEPNRTGIPAMTDFSFHLSFDMRDGTIPIVSMKQVNPVPIIAELCGFLHGATSAAEFRTYGTKIWDKNANHPGQDGAPNAWLTNPFREGIDDLGPIYGAQWRGWAGLIRTVNSIQEQFLARLRPSWTKQHVTDTATGENYDVWTGKIDQLQEMVDGLRRDPYSRRHLVSAWNVGEIARMALPPCHVLFQCKVQERDGQRYLNLAMYQRSADVFLGVPYNITSYAILTHLLAHLTGLKPGKLHLHLGDAHIYMNHHRETLEMLENHSKADTGESRPVLTISDQLTSLDDVRPEHFRIDGYRSHKAIRADMAV